MKTLDKIFTEKQAIQVSEKILSTTKEKIKEQIANEFYSEVEGYLYEIYNNNKAKIKTELIAEITEKFIKEPALYEFKDLREKIWNEHKAEIVDAMTEESVIESIENVLLQYTHRDYWFNWQWKDGIVRVILSNWDKFKDDERIISAFGRENDRLKSQITQLQAKLNEVEQCNEVEP